MGSKAVFIDRDGTINVNVNYLDDPDNFQMYPTVAKGIKHLQKQGFKIIIITNQSGIARGFFSQEILQKIHEKMLHQLSKEGATVDAIYYCPHHPKDNCECRKPRVGLFEKAAEEFNIDMRQSFMIGDRMLDIEAGYKSGCKTILVPENHSKVKEELEASIIKPDYICNDFYSGVLWIVKHGK
jgi:histidinol-phosphate phosphatase family protein